jgi:thioesterase domain-containing protein
MPLAAGMAIHVLEAGPDGVVIEAPIEPNLNHRSTAFGGSVAALAILAGWTLVHLGLRAEGLSAQTVIQKSAVRFDAPIHGAFRAVSRSVPSRDWERFTRSLARRGKGRVHVRVSIEAGGAEVASFEGAYVALGTQESPEGA